MERSSDSAYGELPSSSRLPPLPRGKFGDFCSSRKKAWRRAGDFRSERKSLEEKSADVCAAVVRERREDLLRRLARWPCIAASREEFGGYDILDDFPKSSHQNHGEYGSLI